MDGLLQNSVTPLPIAGVPQLPQWDFQVDQYGNVPMIYGDRQNQQQAAVSAFIVLNGIPQLPGLGVDWLGALTGNTTFGQIDSQINQSISNCGLNYVQKYSILNGKLQVTINKAGGT